ncbi:hypothetical protein N7466_001815 [Penicillium verhagenii]|uniref:uncharacterized protein n=1 Tax=Penicillium verhagenii TaxID=1562060 RepID=UPI0025453AED|nr:uncharacterized protein N7466_001815 [Penicillium verhagenii]KAJ5938681.1 hypothetical protein N7466_001815 [Penicillium verhagenii]
MDRLPESLSSLSPPVLDNDFNPHESRHKISTRLERYAPLNDDDDTVHFLESVFRFLPVEGQVHLASDIDSCDDDERLRKLSTHLDTAMLRPMVVTGGKTPAVIPSPRPGAEDSVEDLLSHDFDSINRRQGQLRRICLQRDNHQCVVTKFWDFDYASDSRPVDAHTSDLEAVYILPFGLGNFQKDERRRHALIWNCLYRYFPPIRNFFHRSDESVNRVDNVMMLTASLHAEFGRFNLVLEESTISGRYRVKTFPQFHNTFLRQFIPDFITIDSPDSQYPSPNSLFLALHASIGNILHATGRGELVEKIMRHLDGAGGNALARDGSTNVGELLSVTSLSALAINPSHSPVPHKKRHVGDVGSWLPGMENQ